MVYRQKTMAPPSEEELMKTTRHREREVGSPHAAIDMSNRRAIFTGILKAD
jgi:hypothetical protein